MPSKSAIGCLLAVVAAAFTLTAVDAVSLPQSARAASAHAASAPDGRITRSEVLARAQNWVNRNVQYNLTRYPSTLVTDVEGDNKYGPDCSGLVSMAWHITANSGKGGNSTDDFAGWSGKVTLGSLHDLLPGDAILRDGHIELFARWKNESDHSKGAWTYSLNGTVEDDGDYQEDWAKGPSANSHGQVGDESWSSMQNYTPIRYKNIVDDVTHVVALGVNGEIYHTMRRADGSWQSAGNVEGQAGTLPGAVTGVASAVVSGELHVLATANDEIFHVARRVGGSWSAWGRVEGQAGEVGAPTSIAAASIDGELEILAVAGGVLRHTGRNADGSWSGWGNVEGQAGEIGAPVSIGATGVGGTLHVVAAAAGVVRHVTQRADGSWSSWGNVEGQAGEVGNPTSVAVTATGGVLEILASAEGVLRHAGRHTDGSWSSWGNVEGQAGELGTPVSVGAASAGNGVLHVLAVNSAGTPYHATQSPGGSWSGWGNIDRQADYPVTIQKISGS
ncbi:hypothetical protein GCM10010412_048910 [Nonomuraea recticatena]|uniref:Uncharacterized protein n=2 Tax=Nonomuraea recticatena TaxID=46178 RepID=A0ABP6EQ07_9ACTN